MNLNSLNFFNPSSQIRSDVDEFETIRLKREALDQKIKLRKDYERKYHEIKIEELEKEMNELKFKNQLANKRNQEILNSINTNLYNIYETHKISAHSKVLKENELKKYSDYLNYQIGNIKNEFNQKLMIRKNELKGITAILEKQNSHNEQVLKIENDYTLKIAKMNEELTDKIKVLYEKNKQLENERKATIENYKKMEEVTRESFYKILSKNRIEEEINISNCAVSDNYEGESKKNLVIKENINILKSKNFQDNVSNEISLNTNKVKEAISELSMLPTDQNKKLSHFKGILDEIRERKLEEKKGSTTNQNVKGAKLRENNILQEKIREKINQLKIEHKISNPLSEQGNLTIREVSNAEKNNSSIFTNKPEILQEEEVFSSVKVVNLNESVLDRENLQEIEEKRKSKTVDDFINEKTELKKLPVNLKIKVVKKIIAQIEKNSKSVKPGIAGNYIYQSKHIYSTNKTSQISKFYEILSSLQEPTNSNKDLNFPNDSLVNLLLEILYSNASPNLNRENLSDKHFDEITLTKDLDKNIKYIFDLIFEHIKKIVMDKKTSPNLAGNIIASSLINFEKDQRMQSNLVAVLERKLSQKNAQVGMNTFNSGFNSNIFINFKDTNFNRTFATNMINNNKISLNLNNTSSKVNSKNVETQGIINSFNEIE
jgi:hypothetical protein